VRALPHNDFIQTGGQAAVKPTLFARTTFCLAPLVAVGTTLQCTWGGTHGEDSGHIFYFLFYSIFRTTVRSDLPNTAAK
jgi:hypothetical protein